MPVARNVTAVLGPTNTGKTHFAVERMLAQASGMIGLPLRLLAREIYDRVRLRTGDHAVALVTGEEKIIPAKPRYWVCTVEAMPSDVEVGFLAIDEIQLAADFERGHIFTDRILNRRGRDETLLLGAATMRPMLEKLLPGTEFVSRPRLSKLSYAGQKKMSRLPARSAIVAFSADMVYAAAELIRRQRGGAAVVMGSLSPRTRNAQVALFQSGDVDYVVATDAIGMGLNMDIDHVAFASTRKFDGFGFRGLTPAELAQIAGRAGRHLNDGTFGVTGEAEPFDNETIERLEAHSFDAVRVLQWRNRDLDFSTLEALRRTLARLPVYEGLTRSQAGPDIEAVEMLARNDEIASAATTPRLVEKLWEVCQIPDYRNISPAEHATLVGRVFQFITTGRGRIDEDWFARQLAHCDKSDGDIDTLSNRIAHVRTWTFIANRADWLESPAFWQQRAKEIEDKLSDALHERLIQRFIDRRTSVLMKRLAQKEELMSTVEEDGSIQVEGQKVGRIEGFRFIPEGGNGAESRTLTQAALPAVAAEIAARAGALAVSADPAISLTRDGKLMWNKAVVGRLAAGASALKPRATIAADEQLTGPDRDAVQARLDKWIGRHIATVLEPLVKLEEQEGLEGIVRGIAFRLVENLGVVPRDQIAEEVKSLGQEDRAKLRAAGARFGAFNVFMPVLLKPAATELRLLLWALSLEKEGKLELENLPPQPGQGLTSAAFDRTTPKGFYGICGYRICGERVVRIDMLERLADLIRDRVFWRARFDGEARPAGSVEGGGFTIIPDMMSLVGASGPTFAEILKSLGFRMQTRQIKKPAAPPPAVADPVAALSETIPEAAAPEAVSSVEPEAVPAEPDVPPAVESAPADAPVAVETVSEETIELEVWWPRDTGPFRREHKPHPGKGRPERGQKRHQRSGPAREEKTGPKPEQPRHPPREKPRKPERPIDPNSPFAALAALKAQMTPK